MNIHLNDGITTTVAIRTFYPLTDLMRINNSFCFSFRLIPFKTLIHYALNECCQTKIKVYDEDTPSFIFIVHFSKRFVSILVSSVYQFWCVIIGGCSVICIFVGYSRFLCSGAFYLSITIVTINSASAAHRHEITTKMRKLKSKK